MLAPSSGSNRADDKPLVHATQNAASSRVKLSHGEQVVTP